MQSHAGLMHNKTNVNKVLACNGVYGDAVFSDCDSGCRGFESHRSPQFPCKIQQLQHAKGLVECRILKCSGLAGEILYLAKQIHELH